MVTMIRLSCMVRKKQQNSYLWLQLLLLMHVVLLAGHRMKTEAVTRNSFPREWIHASEQNSTLNAISFAWHLIFFSQQEMGSTSKYVNSASDVKVLAENSTYRGNFLFVPFCNICVPSLGMAWSVVLFGVLQRTQNKTCSMLCCSQFPWYQRYLIHQNEPFLHVNFQYANSYSKVSKTFPAEAICR